MRLNTKEKRLEARKFYLQPGAQVIDMPEIELQAYVADNPGNRENYYALTVFLGTAGKPAINYYYRTREARDAALQNAIANQQKRIAYKAEQKEKNKGHKSAAAATAAAIRARLKKEFPGIKFKVTSSNFSGGNSVDIHWTDGPRLSDVDSICRQYQTGHFDGMTDSYNYRNISPDLGCPGAKYVHSHRTITDEYAQTLLQAWDALHDWRPGSWEGNTWRMVNDIEREHPELMPYQYEMIQATKKVETADLPRETETTPAVTEQQEKPTATNVIDITDRLRAKREQQETAKAIETFKRDYLPHVNKTDMDLLVSAPRAELGAIIAKICMRIDMEKSLKK